MLPGQIPASVVLYLILYGGVAMVAFVACIYLCLRKGNAFAADVTPPKLLRRWAAAFYGVAFLSHIWWALFVIFSGDVHSVSCVAVAVLDCVMLVTTIAGTLFAMLQDRKRPIWPVVTAIIPYAAFLVLYIVYPNSPFVDIATAYILLIYVLFIIYMVFAVRQYGRWLRDNYADLEHKEVWVSHVLVVVFLLLIISDGVNVGDIVVCYLEQFIQLVLFGLLLWRLETLPQLENTFVEQACSPIPEASQEPDVLTQAQQSLTIPSNIEELLAERCVGTQLYLQHDLTLHQLAQAVGTNRSYLSVYFSSRGTTYNAYINDLRINHFMSLCRKTTAAGQPTVALQLAKDSGFRSYSTFSLAFKQRKGQSVTAWMREMAK